MSLLQPLGEIDKFLGQFLQADDQASVASTASRGGSPFGGQPFWAALRGVQGLERDVRALYLDAKLTLRRKGGLPMQVHGLLLQSQSKPAAMPAAFYSASASSTVTMLEWSRCTGTNASSAAGHEIYTVTVAQAYQH